MSQEINESIKTQDGFSKIAEFSLRRPITVTMIFLSMVIVGLISSRLLPLEQWPQMKFPFISINIAYPSSTPKEVERNIVRPLEEALATIGNIKNIDSVSDTNGANIGIEFKAGADLDEKAMLVQEQIDLTRPLLPDDVRRILLQKAETGGNAILELRITGDIDLQNSYDVINRYLVKPVERVPGVARVSFQGLEPKEVRIMIDSDALKSYGISFGELSDKISQNNFVMASGNFKTGSDDDDRQLRVVPKSQVQDVESFNAILLNKEGVRLADVASVEMVNGDRNYARHLDRKYSVGLEIYNESTANLVEVSDRVLAKIDEIAQTPQMKGIQLVMLNNQAKSVRDSLNEVIMAGIVGALLSMVMLYIFIRDILTTLLVSLSIPISIVITLGVLYFLGLSLNVLSLMGLMLAIGMLVDNSVVISESILTQKSTGKYDIVTSIKKGVSEVMVPVIAGTLTSICVFIPIMFNGGDLIAVFLTHVAASIIAALIISLFLSITVVPLIISRLNKNTEQKVDTRKSWMDAVKSKYIKVLSYTLRHRWITFSSIIFIVVMGLVVNVLFVFSEEGLEDQISRDFWLVYHVNDSFTLDRLKKDVDKIENYLYANQKRFEINTVYSYYEENGSALTKIYLVDESQATKSVADIKKDILKDLPEITTGTPNFRWEKSQGENGLSVFLKGDSQEILKGLLEPVLLELNAIEGVAGAQVENKNSRDEIQVSVNREKAVRLGVDPLTVAQSVNTAMRGINLRDMITENGEMPVIMRFYKTGEFKMEQLTSLPILTNQGNIVTLDTVAEIINTSSAQYIVRQNRVGAIKIEIDLDDDVNKKEIKEQVSNVMGQLNYPSGYNWNFDSGSLEDEEQDDDMKRNLMIAVTLIFILMAALFESLLFPLCVVTSIGFSFIGVFYFFAITGTELTLMALIGMLILIGVVVNNGIVLIDHTNQLRIRGMSRNAAVLQAGKDRLRPILMTVSTTVVGLIPLAVSVSQVGGDGPAYFPMARAIIGGLSFSTVVSLLALPSLYCWLDDLRLWTNDRLHARSLNASKEMQTQVK